MKTRPLGLLALILTSACDEAELDIVPDDSSFSPTPSTSSTPPPPTAIQALSLPEPQHAATPALEERVTPAGIIDLEFDWGRDGVYCSTCNDGDGNNRLTFTDKDQNLWVAHVDPATGDFIPSNGQGELVDIDSAFAKDFGNGPEWMFGTGGSQIVYTKYSPFLPQSFITGSYALAQRINGVWKAGIQPSGFGKYAPLGMLDLDEPEPRVTYQTTGAVYWRVAGDNASESTLELENSGYLRRWVPGTHQLIINTLAPPSEEDGIAYQQIFLYDTDTDELEQLTFDPVHKTDVFMWQAPDYNNEYLFLTTYDETNLAIYRKVDDGTGQDHWAIERLVEMPGFAPYIWSPEPMVYQGSSYIILQLSASDSQLDFSTPTQLAMLGLNPENPSFKMLTNDVSTRRIRSDPEYYVTEDGPYVYYNRYIPPHDDFPGGYDGVWKVDTGLGPMADETP